MRGILVLALLGQVAASAQMVAKRTPSNADLVALPGVEAVTNVVPQKIFRNKLHTLAGIREELQTVGVRREALTGEMAYIKSKVQWAKKKLAGRGAPDGKDSTYAAEIDRWQREVKAWEARLANAEEEILDAKSEEAGLLKALQKAMKGGGTEDVVLPGETLEIFVAEDDTFNELYQVRRGGYIIMPRLGRIFVAGKMLSEVEQVIQAALQSSQLRQATVMVERAQSIAGPRTESGRTPQEVIYLSGAVRRPGPWTIPRGFNPTIVTTLLRSGALSDQGDLTQVRVLRLVQGKGLVEEVNVKEIMAGGGLTADYSLQPEDIVIVPPKDTTTRVYLSGQVNKPGMLDIGVDEEATLAGTLLRAGGIRPGGDLEKVRVLRVISGQSVAEEVNVAEIMRGDGSLPDFALTAGDIIIVPPKALPKRIYLTGNVQHPGVVEVDPEEEATVYTLLVRAGGFARFANLKKAYVLRELDDGVRTRIELNLKAVEKGTHPDLLLNDGDIVVIPEKFFSF